MSVFELRRGYKALRNRFLVKNRLSVLLVVTLAFLTVALPALAAGEPTADISMTPVDTSAIKSVIQTIANVLGAIGSGIILIYGMLHTFGVASSGKNATKRAMAMESLGYVFLSIFIFFALNRLGGVIRGIAESMN